MSGYNGENKHVKALIAKHDGKVMRYRDLTYEAKCAYSYYMAIDGTAWGTPKNEVRMKELVAYHEKMHPNFKVGIVQVPMGAFCDAIHANSDYDHASFAAYHEWYVQNCYNEDNGKSVWPVILNYFDDELLQDGWHRFHSYVERKLKTIPCLYFLT